MNEQNTKIGTIFSDNNLEYLPEAHCYLKIDGKIIDITTNKADFDKIKADLLEEIEIEPFQVADFKVYYHQNYIKKWMFATNSNLIFNKIWKIREDYIEKLSD